MHLQTVFTPKRAEIESTVNDRAVEPGMKSAQPDKTRSISTFTELPERQSAQLFERFRKVSLKIFDKILPFPFFDRVTTELYDLKIRQRIDLFHNLICELQFRRWGRSGRRAGKAQADRSQAENKPMNPKFHYCPY